MYWVHSEIIAAGDVQLKYTHEFNVDICTFSGSRGAPNSVLDQIAKSSRVHSLFLMKGQQDVKVEFQCMIHVSEVVS